MSADEFHEYAAKSIGYMDDQPVLVAAEIEDDTAVAHEIDGTAKLALYFGRVGPMRLRRNREPRPNWAFGMRMTRPLHFCLFQTSAHSSVCSCRSNADITCRSWSASMMQNLSGFSSQP